MLIKLVQLMYMIQADLVLVTAGTGVNANKGASFYTSIFTSDFGKLPVPLHLGKDKYFFCYIWEYIHKIGKNNAIFGNCPR